MNGNILNSQDLINRVLEGLPKTSSLTEKNLIVFSELLFETIRLMQDKYNITITVGLGKSYEANPEYNMIILSKDIIINSYDYIHTRDKDLLDEIYNIIIKPFNITENNKKFKEIFLDVVYTCINYLSSTHELTHITKDINKKDIELSLKDEEKKCDSSSGSTAINIYHTFYKAYGNLDIKMNMEQDKFEKFIFLISIAGALYHTHILKNEKHNEESNTHPTNEERIYSVFTSLFQSYLEFYELNEQKETLEKILNNSIFLYQYFTKSNEDPENIKNRMIQTIIENGKF